MLVRYFMIFAVMVFVSACSSTDDDGSVDSQPTFESAGEGFEPADPLDEIYNGVPVDSVSGGPVPGSQEDFIVNVGDRVFFGTDRFDLDSEARSTLEAQANWLATYPNLNITVGGHADERGTREYNLALGERRANSVKNYLVALGVDPRRVDTVTYGKERPAVAGNGPSAWSQNRRSVSNIN